MLNKLTLNQVLTIALEGIAVGCFLFTAFVFLVMAL